MKGIGYEEGVRRFTNESGNDIKMEVRAITAAEVGGRHAVRVIAEGPDSTADHFWTRFEAETLRDMLCEALGGYMTHTLPASQFSRD